MCPVLVRPFIMKQSNEHQRSHLMEHGIFKLFICFVMASFKNGPWCLPRRIKPGNFLGDIDGISALSHWYWDIMARRPASWHQLVNLSTPQVSVPTSAKTLLPPASVPAALLMMVSPQPSATTITAYFWRFITWSLPRIHRLGQLQNEKERWRRRRRKQQHNGQSQYWSWKGTCYKGSWKAKYERTQTLQNTPHSQNIQHTLLQ